MRKLVFVFVAMIGLLSSAPGMAQGLSGVAALQIGPPGFTNWGPQTANAIIRDVAKVTTTTGIRTAARWAFIGDSTMAGHCALGSCVDSRISSWPYQLGLMMQAAGIPTDLDDFPGCSNAASIALCQTFDTRTVMGTGWSTGPSTWGGETTFFPANTTPTPRTSTPQKAFNQIDVYYIQGNAAASFVVDRAGVTTTGSTISTTVGTLSIGKTTLTWAGSAVLGVININASSATTGRVDIIDVIARDTASPAIEFGFGAVGGSGSVFWTDVTSRGGYSAFYMLGGGAFNPTLVWNGNTVNDFNSPATPLATYQANMTALATQAQSTGGSIFIFGMQSNPASYATVATQQQYGAVELAIAKSLNFPLIDFQYRWTNFANGCALGFYGSNSGCDGRHGSAAGYRDQAAMIMGGIRQLVGP